MAKTTLIYKDKHGVKYIHSADRRVYFKCLYSLPDGQFYIHFMDEDDNVFIEVDITVKYPRDLSVQMLEELGILEKLNNNNPKLIQEFVAINMLADNKEICLNCLAKNLAYAIETALTKRREAIIDCFNSTTHNDV